MNGIPYANQAAVLARRSFIQALWPPALAVAILMMHVAAVPIAEDSLFATAARLAAVASGLAVLGLSAVLFFDALLFRLMASYEDEWKGGAAVDDILARMRLKPTPSNTRSLAERAAGTRRLVTLQRVAFAVLLLALALPLFSPRA
jgi:hypothetical protein